MLPRHEAFARTLAITGDATAAASIVTPLALTATAVISSTGTRPTPSTQRQAGQTVTLTT